MKITKNPYHFLENYCLRTSIFSLNFLKEILNSEKIDNNLLRQLWENKFLKELIFLSSPVFYSELKNYLNSPDDNKVEKLKHTLLKYLCRASSRCTPFGLSAGVSFGNFDYKSDIELKSINNFERITRFDTNYISSLINFILSDEKIINQLKFYPNTSLYKVSDHYRYIEYKLEKAKRNYSIEGLGYSEYLEKVLVCSKSGNTISTLADVLVDDEISIEEARGFINTLIENQILVSELEINVTGKDSLVNIISTLSKLKKTQTIVSSLEAVQNKLKNLDKAVGNDIEKYFSIIKDVEKLNAQFEIKYLFQTDLFCTTKINKLSVKHAYSIKKLIPFFNKISTYTERDNLKRFKKSYLERYEYREMPLSKVLDVETGIGYSQNKSYSDTTPFLNDINPTPLKTKTNQISVSTDIDYIIQTKFLDALEDKLYSIEFTDKDFSHIENDWNNTADTISGIFEIVKIDGKEQISISGLSSGAGKLLARFCYGNNELLSHTKNISSIEQLSNENKILAEICHLPEARIGNILKRPHLREYEIPYLAKSDLPISQQIPIDDILISIVNNKIVLKSKRLQKEIIPQLTNAHNYSLNPLPIYHFLCDLQYQNTKSYIGFSWPSITENHKFYPRVIYKNCIISKAEWHLYKKDIKLFVEKLNDKISLMEYVQNWRNLNRVPQYVQLIEHDNKLLIDLNNYESVNLLFSHIKNKSKCVLEEFLFANNTLVNRGNEQFTNECVISFYKEKTN